MLYHNARQPLYRPLRRRRTFPSLVCGFSATSAGPLCILGKTRDAAVISPRQPFILATAAEVDTGAAPQMNGDWVCALSSFP
jgi:hypothetical protein